MLDRLEELQAAGARFDRSVVTLAAWFHDAVYDGGPDAEARSASWAREALAGLVPVATADRVAALVLVTAGHRPGDDPDAAALCDADLAILASGRDRYAAYAADVRREYAEVPDPDFAAGRAAVLEDLLDRPALFATAPGRARWEAAARRNVTAELARLRAG